MSEILQGLELRVQAQGNADAAEPVIDMRCARLLPATTGTTVSQHLPQTEESTSHAVMGESNEPLINATYLLDTDTEEGLDVKGLLTQLLTFPRPAGGIVPDTWGSDERAEIKRISTDADSVYTLDRGVQSFIDGLRDDFRTIRNTKSV
ncbi:MAG: hypothetical protein IT342_18365 [Candidatus Melainabacteria bacterium]|nr:hypothetical protein [Candidatus Melainabacteria bacterium]